MKLVISTLLAALAAFPCSWGAEKPPTAAPPDLSALLARNQRDLERNTALGAALTMRSARQGELEELQRLAERGLREAEEAVLKHPDSAQAHYLLGSWLLYGYRVREVRSLVVVGETATTRITRQVTQGLRDDVERGLAALKRACELEPDNARYLIDYGAALLDCDHLSEALTHLKAVWLKADEFAPADRLQVAILLSRVREAQGMLADARQWVYAGLERDPRNAAAVQHLRWLDQVLPEAEAAAAEAQRAAEAAAEAEAELEAEAAAAEEEPAPDGAQPLEEEALP